MSPAINPGLRSAELVATLADALDETARSAHNNGQVASRGGLHGGDFDSCESMLCADNRALLAECPPSSRAGQ